ncbi:MAG: cellulase family glycosylhydrolase [Armatimonadota bacterium]
MMRQLKYQNIIRIVILTAIILIGIAAASSVSAASTQTGTKKMETPMSRIAIRSGKFIEKNTGKPFIPLGVNYYRTGVVSNGKLVHATFCPGFYDHAYIEKMMSDLSKWGFNTVRTFQVYHVGKDGIITSPTSREISPEYLANMVHFLQQARKHNIHVIFSWDIWLPVSEWWSGKPLASEGKYSLQPAWDEGMGVNNYRITRDSIRIRANAIVSLIEALRRKDPSLLNVVMTWELENEIYFNADSEPFKSRKGTFHFAGKDYLMSSDEQTQSLMDDMIVQWADICTDAIHRTDKDALVSAGVFTYYAIGREKPGTLSKDKTGDTRIPARPMALLRSRLDYLDIHLYAWKTETEDVDDYLAHNLASVEWDRLTVAARKAGKPIMSGETGVCAQYLRQPPEWTINHDLGVDCFRKQQIGMKNRQISGVLYWHYGNPDSKLNDDFPSLSLFPQYMKVMQEVWR